MSSSQAAHPLNSIKVARNKLESPINAAPARSRHLTPGCVPKAAHTQRRHTANTSQAAQLQLDAQRQQFQRPLDPPPPPVEAYNRQPIARYCHAQQQTTPIPRKQVPLLHQPQQRAMGGQPAARYTHAQQQTTPAPVTQRRAPLPVMQDQAVGDQQIATFTNTQQQTTPAPIKQEPDSSYTGRFSQV